MSGLLTLVRHASPEWLTADGATNDPGLSSKGLLEANRLRFRFTDERFTDVWVSDRRRATKTADRLRLDYSTHKWLAELGQPDRWEADTLDVCRRELAEFRERPYGRMWDGFEGGEPIDEFFGRVVGGLQYSLNGAGVRKDTARGLWIPPENDVNILIVGHAGTFGVAMSFLLHQDVSPSNIWDTYGFDHTGVSLLRLVPCGGLARWQLVYHNDTSHLRDGGLLPEGS